VRIVPRDAHRGVNRRISDTLDDASVDDLRVGRVLRAVRHRRNLRQRDVATSAGVNQSVISDLELGKLESVGLATARRVAQALDVQLVMTAHWRGGELDRLLDRAHASIVEHVIGFLRAAEWEVLPEFTFNVYGDRGSVDILAWHAGARILLIIEVKATLTDIQAMLGSMSKKVRLVPGVVREAHGWRPRSVAVLLIAPGTHGNRSILARHAATFDAALPARTREVRTWLRRPSGSLAGIWLLSPRSIPQVATSGARRRVRHGR
jgi:transcriptional regulator with XRE-family HTH domain